jgi:hypothetical protein
MKLNRYLALVLVFFLSACQPAAPATITIIDGDKTIVLQTNDHVLSNGLLVSPELPITKRPITLQLRRAVTGSFSGTLSVNMGLSSKVQTQRH